MRTIRTLVGLLVFALVSSFPAIESGLTPTAYAEEEESSEPTDEGDSKAPAEESKEEDNEADQDKETGDAERRNDTDQDKPAEEPAEAKDEEAAACRGTQGRQTCD